MQNWNYLTNLSASYTWGAREIIMWGMGYQNGRLDPQYALREECPSNCVADQNAYTMGEAAASAAGIGNCFSDPMLKALKAADDAVIMAIRYSEMRERQPGDSRIIAKSNKSFGEALTAIYEARSRQRELAEPRFPYLPRLLGEASVPV